MFDVYTGVAKPLLQIFAVVRSIFIHIWNSTKISYITTYLFIHILLYYNNIYSQMKFHEISYITTFSYSRNQPSGGKLAGIPSCK